MLTQHDKERLKQLSPEERTQFVGEILDYCILLTPTSPARERMTSANIGIMEPAGGQPAAERTK